MTTKQRQLEEMLAETKDSVVRMQLTQMLSEELQRQNGIIKKVAGAIDSLLREMIGFLGKRNPKNTSRDKTKICKTTKKQSAQEPRKEEQDDAQKQPDDLAEIIAIWPKLPEHVKAAISDIVRIS
jgi:hypothetical protein